MRKKIRRRAFWHNIKFKYRLTIVNENTLEEVAGLHVSKLNGLSVFVVCLYGDFPDGCSDYCVYAVAQLSAGVYKQ